MHNFCHNLYSRYFSYITPKRHIYCFPPFLSFLYYFGSACFFKEKIQVHRSVVWLRVVSGVQLEIIGNESFYMKNHARDGVDIDVIDDIDFKEYTLANIVCKIWSS